MAIIYHMHVIMGSTLASFSHSSDQIYDSGYVKHQDEYEKVGEDQKQDH